MKRIIYVFSIVSLFVCGITDFGSGNFFKNKKDKNKEILMGLLVLSQSGYQWDLPAGFPTPNVPAGNPMSNDKVLLGRFLFYEKKLSQNQTQSCSSCHSQEFAFTDQKQFGIGSTGEVHPRNAQNLANVAYNNRLTWSNNNMTSLEIQARGPMFGITP
ncbi:MAG: di-heme enzyme, partial [Leptospira sp.]|nr:di-heme enzyme [Leptospira sp.]